MDERTGRAFALGGSRVFVIDTTAGRVLRSVQIGPATDIAVDERADRVLIARPRRNTVSVLDAVSGRLLHVVHLAAPTQITVVEQSGYALVAANRATSLLDTRSGRVRFTIPLDAYASVTPDVRDGRLFAVNSYRVDVLDARNGRRLRTLTFGLKPRLPGADQMFAPLSITVDGSARLAFVIDDIHNRVSSLDPRTGLSCVPPPCLYSPCSS